MSDEIYKCSGGCAKNSLFESISIKGSLPIQASVINMAFQVAGLRLVRVVTAAQQLGEIGR